jgi:hypothetical protein
VTSAKELNNAATSFVFSSDDHQQHQQHQHHQQRKLSSHLRNLDLAAGIRNIEFLLPSGLVAVAASRLSQPDGGGAVGRWAPASRTRVPEQRGHRADRGYHQADGNQLDGLDGLDGFVNFNGLDRLDLLVGGVTDIGITTTETAMPSSEQLANICFLVSRHFNARHNGQQR